MSTKQMEREQCSFYGPTIAPNKEFMQAVADNDEEVVNFMALKDQLKNPQFDAVRTWGKE